MLSLNPFPEATTAAAATPPVVSPPRTPLPPGPRTIASLSSSPTPYAATTAVVRTPPTPAQRSIDQMATVVFDLCLSCLTPREIVVCVGVEKKWRDAIRPQKWYPRLYAQETYRLLWVKYFNSSIKNPTVQRILGETSMFGPNLPITEFPGVGLAITISFKKLCEFSSNIRVLGPEKIASGFTSEDLSFRQRVIEEKKAEFIAFLPVLNRLLRYADSQTIFEVLKETNESRNSGLQLWLFPLKDWNTEKGLVLSARKRGKSPPEPQPVLKGLKEFCSIM